MESEIMKNAAYKIIEIKNITSRGENPRKLIASGQVFDELVESIKVSGVLVPVHVRAAKGKGKYQLLAGARRLAAVDEAKLLSLPAIDHGSITDEEAFEITFVENFAREDLTPMEEGEAVAILLKKYKGDVEAVSSKFGKSIRWVSQRAAMNSKICAEVKHLIETDPDCKELTASHISQLVGLPDDIQVNVLDSMFLHGELRSVKELADYITSLLHPLQKTLWPSDMADKIVLNGKTVAVRCATCDKRSSYQSGLFDDTIDAEKLKAIDRCLDLQCWEARLNKYIKSRANELRATHENLEYVSSNGSLSYYERRKLQPEFGSLITNDHRKLKRPNKNTVPAILVDGPSAGQLVHVKITDSASGTAMKKKNKPAAGKTLSQKQQELKKKRWAAVLRYMCEAIGNTTMADFHDAVKAKDNLAAPGEQLVRLVCYVGTCADELRKLRGRTYDRTPDMTKYAKFELSDFGAAKEELFDLVTPNLISIISYNGPLSQTPNKMIAQAKAISDLLGLDCDEMFKRATKECPEPKSWVKKELDK